MGISAQSGPRLSYGIAAFGDTNTQLGPDGHVLGNMIMDPRRPYSPGQSENSPIYGWYGTTFMPVIRATPAVAAVASIAASQTPTAGTPLALVTVTGAGVTVGTSATNIVTGEITPGLLALDGGAATLPFGDSGTIRLYDPTTALDRTLVITSVGNDSGATFTVVGFDAYGVPVTEVITGANAGAAAGVRPFKYIQSITPAGALSGDAVEVGTGDVFGMPLFLEDASQILVLINGVPADPAAVTVGVAGTSRGSISLAGITGSVPVAVYYTPNPASLAAASTGGLPALVTALLGA